MLTGLLRGLRDRFHPVWRLRRWTPYRRLQNRIDFAVPLRVGRVTRYVYLLRDCPTVLFRPDVEARTASILDRVCALIPVECFVDVGANIGDYSWRVANRVSNARILMFEPDPRNAALLSQSVSRSGLDSVRVYAMALSDRNGTAPFIIDDASGAAGSLIDQRGSFYNLQDAYRLSREVIVETRTMDEFIGEMSPARSVMKVDVEGAEDLVFSGAARVLEKIRPVIFGESFGESGLQRLRSGGYRVFGIDQNGNYVALPMERTELAAQLGLESLETAGPRNPAAVRAKESQVSR